MSLTVITKPSGFQPVGGGRLDYVFSESTLTGKTNYRVRIELNGLGLPVFEFRLDAALQCTADIAPILRSALALDETTASRIISTYVKYQAFWDESSDAQVNLTGDVIYAYVGNNHYLNERSNYDVASSDGNATMTSATGVFLSYDKLTLWKDRKFFIDFLCNGTLPSTSRLRYYNRDTLVVSNISTFDGTVKTMQSIEVTIAVTGRFYILITNAAGDTYYGILSCEVVEECDNAVYLRWINDYGGLTHYLFDYNQIFGFQIDTDERFKELNGEVNGITFDTWKMLNELNRRGVIYNDNYKLGQFVEDVSTYTDPVAVIIQPREERTETKRIGHDFTVSIRYPVVPNTEI